MEDNKETKWFTLFWSLVLALWLAGASLVLLGYIVLGVTVALSASVISLVVTYTAAGVSDRLERRRCERV